MTSPIEVIEVIEVTEHVNRDPSFPSVTRAGSTFFDDYIFGDWSANARPKRGKDSIWLCRARFSDDGALAYEIENPITRTDAFVRVRQWLGEAVTGERRALVGLDFPYGMPSDSYALLATSTPFARPPSEKRSHASKAGCSASSRFTCSSSDA